MGYFSILSDLLEIFGERIQQKTPEIANVYKDGGVKRSGMYIYGQCQLIVSQNKNKDSVVSQSVKLIAPDDSEIRVDYTPSHGVHWHLSANLKGIREHVDVRETMKTSLLRLKEIADAYNNLNGHELK